jgi:hypothetical protein
MITRSLSTALAAAVAVGATAVAAPALAGASTPAPATAAVPTTPAAATASAGPATPAAPPSATPSRPGKAARGAHPGHRQAGPARAFKGVHAQWVTRGKDATYVTHQAIRGQVTATSAASVTVKAPDGYTATFTLAGSTVLRIRGAGKGVAGSAKDIHPGDRVVVVGTGAGRAVATHLLDRGPAGKAAAASPSAQRGTPTTS